MVEFVKKYRLIILIVLIVIIIAGLVYYFNKKRIVKEKVVRVNFAIDSNIGLVGTDVDSVLLNVKQDDRYTPSNSDLLKMNDDDEDIIVTALKGKTKAQIKKMVSVFASKFGKKFNDHLNESFTHWYRPYEKDSYKMILTTIQNAK